VRLIRARSFEVEYHIIGDGGYLEALTFCRHQLELQNTVEFLGALPREQVREQLVWADVFLHAAVSEGFCNAVLEAQAMELPVVTSDADGLADNVVDTVTGFVVPRRSPEKLAERVLILARDGELRIAMGNAGRQRVIKHFNVQNQITRFVELYEALYNDGMVRSHG
jgi:colanic acid/amylovoran biosynthesis glycosyltransferase